MPVWYVPCSLLSFSPSVSSFVHSSSIFASISRISTEAAAAAAAVWWTNRPNDVDFLRRLQTIMYVQRNAFCISSRFVVDEHCRLFLLFVVVGDNYAKGIDTCAENERKCAAIILMTFVTDGNPSSNDDTIGALKSIGNLLSIRSVRHRLSYLLTYFLLVFPLLGHVRHVFDFRLWCLHMLLAGEFTFSGVVDRCLFVSEKNFHFTWSDTQNESLTWW